MNKIGSIYDSTSDWQQRFWLELWTLVEVEKSVRSGLDLGCGSGKRTKDLLRIFPGLDRVVGIDADPSMIQTAKKDNAAGPIVYQQLEMERLAALERSAVDLVVANFSLHWLEAKEALLQELNRRTRPGAWLLIATCSKLPDLLTEIDAFVRSLWSVREPSPFFYLNQKQWMSLLGQSGWEVVQWTVKSEPHLVPAPQDFLPQWYAASAGRAFYGRPADRLAPADRSRLMQQLATKYLRDNGAWIFNEDILLLAARRRN